MTILKDKIVIKTLIVDTRWDCFVEMVVLSIRNLCLPDAFYWRDLKKKKTKQSFTIMNCEEKETHVTNIHVTSKGNTIQQPALSIITLEKTPNTAQNKDQQQTIRLITTVLM